MCKVTIEIDAIMLNQWVISARAAFEKGDIQIGLHYLDRLEDTLAPAVKEQQGLLHRQSDDGGDLISRKAGT